MKIAGMMLLVIGMSGWASATIAVPEISSGSAVSALALLSGAVLVVRGKTKR